MLHSFASNNKKLYSFWVFNDYKRKTIIWFLKKLINIFYINLMICENSLNVGNSDESHSYL